MSIKDSIIGWLFKEKDPEQLLQEYQDIQKSFDVVDTEINQLAKRYFIERCNFNERMRDENNSSIQDRIKSKYDKFLDIHKSQVADVNKRFTKIRKQRELIQKSLNNHKSIHQESDGNYALNDKTKEEEIEKANILGKYGEDVLNYLSEIISNPKNKRTPKQTKYADFILFNEMGEILLLKRSQWEDDHQEAWVIPGGHVDEGETCQEAAQRELVEESGIWVPIDECKKIGQYKDEKVYIEYFTARINSKEQLPILQLEESSDYKWVPIYDIPEYPMIFNMQKNIMKVLGISPEKEVTNINKADIREKYGNDVADYVESILDNNGNLLEKGILEDELIKSFGQDIAEIIIKSFDPSKYIKKEKWVTKNGKTYKQNFYYKIGDEEKETETPVGAELSPSVKGLDIQKYSDKSIVIKGDTYANVDLMRSIKQETGFGAWNSKIKGWIFGLNQIDKVLGLIWSDVKQKDEEKADAIQNQKNSSLSSGDEVNIEGEKGKVEEVTSDNEDIKYNVTLEDGTKLENVSEKVIETTPETDDKKISEIVNNAQPENRVKTEKKLYGIKPIEDIYNYSLEEYMKMHGLTDEDVKQAINKLKSKKEEGEKKKTSSGGGGGTKSDKKKTEGLSKQQLISKLIYKHYQAVKVAIDNGSQINDKVLADYEDLKEAYGKKRQAMSEETKRKISEALKKNKAEETKLDRVKKEYEKDLQQHLNKFKETPLSEKKIFIDNLKKETLKAKQRFEAPHFSDIIKDLAEDEYIFYKDILMPAIADELKKEIGIDKKEPVKNPETEKEIKEVEEVTGREINKTNYIPKRGEDFTIGIIPNQYGSKEVVLQSKDYTDIPPLDVSIPKQNKILQTPKPYFIPEINQEKFKRNGYTLSAVKIDEDKYLVALDGFTGQNRGYMFSNNAINVGGRFAIMSLDAYVATQNYYQLKAKQELKENIIKQREDFLESLRKRLADAEVKGDEKEIERLKYNLDYYSKKKPKAKRLSILSSGKMTYDQMDMIHSFNRGENGEQVSRTETWVIYHDLQKVKDQKSLDLSLQQEYLDSAYTKGAKTSYGDSGTKDNLFEDYGVKVKRQNGDEINDKEINEIKGALDSVASVFGNNKQMNQEFGLKISHSGDVLMHARKAVGLFHPFYNAIGVSASYGQNQFKFTFGHEYAHFMDYWIGKKTGNHYSSDKQGSTANQIANTFGRLMNKPSKYNPLGYWGRSCEKFARALEQYHAIETHGDESKWGGGESYYSSEYYLSEENYKQVKPLIERFLQENKELLKAIGFDFDILEKALDQGIISEDMIEKAWKSHPIGTVVTRKDGIKYKKVSNTGDSKQDWKPVKSGNKPEKTEEGDKPNMSGEELKDAAKNTSETALQSAIKNSKDPEVRQTAHEELNRREKEEKPQEEEGKKQPEKKEDKGNDLNTIEGIEAEIKRLRDIDTDDLDEISVINDEIQKLLKKRKTIQENKQSERKVSFEEYRKDFNSFNGITNESKGRANEFYKSEAKNIKATDQELADIADYVGENYTYVRYFLSDPNGYKEEYGDDELMQPMVDGISSFILKNKIKENLSLNRRVKGEEGVQFFKSLKEGDIYEDKSFSSSSLIEQNIFGDFNIEILAKKGSSVANIDNEGEFEYLIDKDSKFRVLKTSETGIIVELL